jgi:predicted GNAT family acetyltransferase
MEITVADAPARHRFEARVDGQLAGFAAYRLDGDLVVFTHTVVEPRYEGHGVGSRLVQEALAAVGSRGLGVLVQCPFVTTWLGRHPDVAAQLDLRDGAAG